MTTKEYFSHDYGTRHKKKMAALRKEKKMRGYGLFWVIVEMLHEDSTRWMDLDELTYIAIGAQSDESAKYVQEFIDHCINRYKVFIQDENRFTTEKLADKYPAGKPLRLWASNVKLWYRIINAVFARDSYTCHYCGKVGGKLECDHVIPFSKGGSNDMANLVTACQRCNRSKKDQSVEMFIARRVAR